ncbi:MAG: hypothetical protein KGL39_23565 [Patescibacteria group bacterium]|nr:hypothetical protein [Patescibacteria group bacterium]
MMSLPLQQLPNQSFTVFLDNNQWDITLKTVNDMTVASLTLNGTLIIENIRAAAGSFLIPALYQESGNFFFVTSGYMLPYYTQFTITQYLIYVSAAELAAARVEPTTIITSSFFNPIASLPLRFAPSGYVAA